MDQTNHLGSDRVAWKLSLVAVLFGVLCRLSQYAANTSLWHDEAFVALNVLHKSLFGLFGPLEWNEPAPPGFLVLEKLIVITAGRSEYMLRLIPFAVGLSGLVGFALLARRMSDSKWNCFWAILLMAASAKLIVQANEVKHFTLDVACSIAVVALAASISKSDRPRRLLLVWGGVSAIGLWLSFASLFVFSGTSLGLLIAVRRWKSYDRVTYFLANFLVLLSLGLLMGPIESQLAEAVTSFWLTSFPDTGSPPAFLFWLGKSLVGFFNYFWQPFGAALLALALVGSVRFFNAGRQTEWALLCLPVFMSLAASFFHRWPFGGNQHMVFAAPAVFLIVAEGIESVRPWLRQRYAGLEWVFITLLFLPNVTDAAYRIFSPRLRHEVRPVVEYVQHSLESRDQLIVFDSATVEFYTGQNFHNHLPEPNPSSRVWVIATRSGYKEFPYQVEDLLQHLRSRRQSLNGVEEFGAAAYLFSEEPLAQRQGIGSRR